MQVSENEISTAIDSYNLLFTNYKVILLWLAPYFQSTEVEFKDIHLQRATPIACSSEYEYEKTKLVSCDYSALNKYFQCICFYISQEQKSYTWNTQFQYFRQHEI